MLTKISIIFTWILTHLSCGHYNKYNYHVESETAVLWLQEAEEKNPRLLLFPEEMKFLKDAAQ